MTNVGGLDLSLNTTAYATQSKTVRVKPGARRGVDRIVYVRDEIKQLVAVDALDVLVMEGPAYMSKAAMAHEMGGMWWAVRIGLEDFEGLAVVVVSPSTLKKYATGKGNASKELVLVEAVKRLGYEGADHNEADALWLREIGCDLLLSTYEARVPAAHRKALEALR